MYKPLPLLACLAVAACGRDAAHVASHPSTAEIIAAETELLRLTLTPETEKRLGILTTVVASGKLVATRQASGEIVVPPTNAAGVPTGSTADLQQMAALQTAADGEIARASVQARLTRTALDRAAGLVSAEAGSVKARDEAAAALDAAEAALATAREQRSLLGPPIADINQQAQLWVRVSVFASDLGAIQRLANASVRPLGSTTPRHAARPVQALPSANAAAGTVDLFYSVANAAHALRVGQRVAVDLPLQGAAAELSVRSSAIVRDIYGGEWVYVRTEPNKYVRQRIEVAAESNGNAFLTRGPRAGAEVVTAGAAELFGTEFGAAH